MSADLNPLLAKRYASALLKVAQEGNMIDKIIDDLKKIKTSLLREDDFKRLSLASLHNANAFQEVVVTLGTKLEIDTVSINFLKLLVQNRRFSLLASICASFSRILEKEKGIEQADIETAREIDVDSKKEAEAFFENFFKKTLNFNWQINPALLAGFRARVETIQYDASLSGVTNRLHRHMKEGA